MPSVIFLTIDGLGAKHIGPYGNTWIETPAFNQLATESLLLGSVYAPFANPEQSLDALLSGANAFGNTVSALRDTNLLSWLETQKVTTKLLTDDPSFTDFKLSAQFQDQVELTPPNGVDLAAEWDDTHTAKFFAQSIQAIEQLNDNELLWLHTRGLGNPWDAPYEFRNQFADEEDPEPTGSAQVPSLQLDADYDPDTLHEMQCAFAGQIVLLDQCLAVLLSVVQATAASKQAVFVLTSPRGFPLGEHLRVGWKDAQLYHELLHVPAFIRYPDGKHALQRKHGLGEVCEISQAVVDWYGEQNAAAASVEHTRTYSASFGEADALLRISSWQLRFEEANNLSETNVELYLKPDDQNEVNNVSDRCDHVVEGGRQFLGQLTQGRPADVPESLLEPPT